MAVSSQRVLETKSGPIAFELVRSSRRRTIEIAVLSAQKVKVSAPRYALVRDIHAFIKEKSDWIRNKLQEAQSRQRKQGARGYRHGQAFPFMGEWFALKVRSGGNRRPHIFFDAQGWEVVLPECPDACRKEAVIKSTMIKWYRRQAEEVLGTRLFQLARDMGQQPQQVAVRTHRRIWGNCDSRNRRIHLNWQLILMPAQIIDYVLIHELCHLEVANHSTRFWKKVGTVLPEYPAAKQWLKRHAEQYLLP